MQEVSKWQSLTKATLKWALLTLCLSLLKNNHSWDMGSNTKVFPMYYFFFKTEICFPRDRSYEYNFFLSTPGFVYGGEKAASDPKHIYNCVWDRQARPGLILAWIWMKLKRSDFKQADISTIVHVYAAFSTWKGWKPKGTTAVYKTAHYTKQTSNTIMKIGAFLWKTV